jgi:CHAT domain-containing protein
VALCCLLTQGVPAFAAQPRQISAVDQAVVDRALAADTDDARAALCAEHPEIGTDPMRFLVSDAALKLGIAGETDKALNGHRTVLLATTRAGNVRGRLISLNAIGFLTGQRGDFAAAEPLLIEARAIAESTGEATFIISASNNLGIVQRLQGKFEDAIANYQRVLPIAEAAGRQDSVARTLNNLAVVAEQQGDSRAALDYLTRSLAIKEALGQTQELITASLNIGVLHRDQRNFPLALDYFERSRARAVAAGDRRALIVVLSAIGELHASEGRYGRAKEVLTEALGLAEREREPTRTSTIWHHLGAVARAEHRWADAEKAFAQSVEIREASGDKPGMADSLTGLAELFEAQGQHERALEQASRSVEIARAIGLARVRWRALSILGRVNVALGRTEPAVRALGESIDVIEGIRRRVAGGDQDFGRFFEDKTAPYYELAAAYAAAGRPADAFAAAERARARVLLDVIETGKPIVGALAESERRKEVELDRAIVSIAAQRDAVAAQRPAQPDRVRALDEALVRARRAREDWQFQAYAAHPDVPFGRGEAPVVSLDESAAVVATGTAIAMFMSSVDETRLLLLTRPAGQDTPSLRMYTIALSRDHLTRRAQEFNRRISRRDLGFAPAARALYTTLLGAVDSELQRAGRVVIVPDGSLWNVPFQALITPRGRFLIEERAVSYAPSVSALRRLDTRRQRRTARATQLVALGDPAVSASSRRLPEAAREVRALAAMYGAGSGLYVGADATEARFADAAPAANVLHVATHGELVGSHPMYSFVTLAGTAGAAELARDGRVEAWEIANMTLQADLVVLSACETARGEVGGGEGVIGLAWSLFAAGASTAAVSLWRVDSASTTDLMLAFHRAALARGGGRASPADAMRTAARTLLASSQYRHPFYWAGFVVIGAP